MTLEDLLKMKMRLISPDSGERVPAPVTFVVNVQEERQDGVHFIIHPVCQPGDTLDFVVNGNDLKPL